MGFKLMTNLIQQGKKTKAQLTKMANVYYAAGQLSDEEYAEIMEKIEAMM